MRCALPDWRGSGLFGRRCLSLCDGDWWAASRVLCAAPLGFAWIGGVWWECVSVASLCHWDRGARPVGCVGCRYAVGNGGWRVLWCRCAVGPGGGRVWLCWALLYRVMSCRVVSRRVVSRRVGWVVSVVSCHVVSPRVVDSESLT